MRSEHEANMTMAETLMECCNGMCNQGRNCPVRQACRLPERRRDTEGEPLEFVFAEDAVASSTIAVVLVLACIVVALLLAGWLR